MQENSMIVIQSLGGFSELVSKKPIPKAAKKKISESARGEHCWIRFDDICNGDRDTVVFAHYRDLGLGFGTGYKDCTVARPAHRAMMNWTGDLSCLNEILCEIPTADNPFDIGSI